METRVETAEIVVLNDDNFVDEIERHEGLAMVDFWASWCGPCHMVAPVVAELATDYEGRVKVGKLDVDANAHTAAKFDVRSLPTILFFRKGEVVDAVVGAVPRTALEGRLRTHL